MVLLGKNSETDNSSMLAALRVVLPSAVKSTALCASPKGIKLVPYRFMTRMTAVEAAADWFATGAAFMLTGAGASASAAGVS